jgi:hypothetical protein
MGGGVSIVIRGARDGQIRSRGSTELDVERVTRARVRGDQSILPDGNVEVVRRGARIRRDVVPGVGYSVLQQNDDERQSRSIEHLRWAARHLPDWGPVAVGRSRRRGGKERQGRSQYENSKESSHAPLFMERSIPSTQAFHSGLSSE